jgi:hypothetical protein
MMGHKSIFVRNGTEVDAIYARHMYRYLENRPKIVKLCKRSINKRERKYNKEQTKSELENE